MAVVDKLLDRVEKLLRLAAPTSGAPEPERASAALEAARLVAEYDLVVQPRRRRRRSDIPGGTWELGMALRWCSCARCNGAISREDVIWIRVRSNAIDYVHNYAPCNVGLADG